MLCFQLLREVPLVPGQMWSCQPMQLSLRGAFLPTLKHLHWHNFFKFTFLNLEDIYIFKENMLNHKQKFTVGFH